MSEVKFTTRPVIYISIRGQDTGQGTYREDGGLVNQFLAFLNKEKITAAVRLGGSGRGKYDGFFVKRDAAKIERWLKEQGANWFSDL